MHDRVDLHALDLYRVLADGVRVARQRGRLGGIDGRGRRAQQGDDNEHGAAEDDRVRGVERSEPPVRAATGWRDANQPIGDWRCEQVGGGCPDLQGDCGCGRRNCAHEPEPGPPGSHHDRVGHRQRPGDHRGQVDERNVHVDRPDESFGRRGDDRQQQSAIEGDVDGIQPGLLHLGALREHDREGLRAEQQSENRDGPGGYRLNQGPSDRVARLCHRLRLLCPRCLWSALKGRPANGHLRHPGPAPAECRPRPHDAADRPWWAPVGRFRRTSRGSDQGTRARSSSRSRAALRRA